MTRQRFDDKTGWEIVWTGEDGELLPSRPSLPSEIWVALAPKRKYTKTGRYAKKGPQEEAPGESDDRTDPD